MIAIALQWKGKRDVPGLSPPHRLPRGSELGSFPREPLRRKKLSAGSISNNCYAIKTQTPRPSCAALNCMTPSCLRNRKHSPCFCWAIRKVRVLENEKCCKITSCWKVFPQLFRVQKGKSPICFVCARVIDTSTSTSVSKIYMTYLSPEHGLLIYVWLVSMIMYRV